MFTLEQIHEIGLRAAAEKWPYHYLFNSLKSIGVERYETNVLTHEIKYVGEGTSLVVPAPEGFVPLTLGMQYNVEALKLAIERVQRRDTTYAQFLGEIAAAGISFYRVDMKPRTITYHGSGRNKYVEKVQES